MKGDLITKMPINASPEYLKAEKEYLEAQNLDDKIYWLEEMIRKAPKHKSSENFLSELKTRLKKLKEKSDKLSKKSGGRRGIRKEGFQFVLVGKANSGKSLLLNKLTNANSKVSDFPFGTREPIIGTFFYEGVHAQVVDIPSLGSENFDVGLVNTADCLVIVVEKLEDIDEIEKILFRAHGKRIIVVNKVDKLDNNAKRKLEAKIKSKRLNGFLVSAKTGEGFDELRGLMFSKMGVIRIYMKEPGKSVKEQPMVLHEGATVREVAEQIRKGFSQTVKETRLTGPSGKFANQKVGLNHILKDRDVVEFHTR